MFNQSEDTCMCELCGENAVNQENGEVVCDSCKTIEL